MPFGSESTGDQNGRGHKVSTQKRSPMPFGSESTGDHDGCGPHPPRGGTKSPMPFGSESTGDTARRRLKSCVTWQVTNAFRQRVHWGRYGYGYGFGYGDGESPMPFGSESTGDLGLSGSELKEWIYVTNAFRQRVHWGPDTAKVTTQ